MCEQIKIIKDDIFDIKFVAYDRGNEDDKRQQITLDKQNSNTKRLEFVNKMKTLPILVKSSKIVYDNLLLVRDIPQKYEDAEILRLLADCGPPMCG
jgi:hypothetical protein